MAFTMRHGLGPFRQEATEQTQPVEPAKLTMPVKPDFSLPEYQGQGTEMRTVPQGRPKNRIVRRAVKELKASLGSNVLTGDVSTTEAYTRRSGSWLGNALTGSGYNVTKDFGNVNVSGDLTGEKMDEAKSEEFYDTLKSTLKEGKGAQIVNGQITSGGEHTQEFKFDKKKRAESEYNKQVQAFNKQENQAKEAARLAGIKAERDAQRATQAQTKQDNQAKEAARLAKIQEERNARLTAQAEARAKNVAAAEAKKNGGKKPVEETQPATNEPVAQQNRTPFYQRGMMSDKMDLQNKNKKVSATSPLEQERNPNTNEKLVSSKTTTEKGLLGTRPGTFTTTTNDYKTPGSNNVSSGEKMSNADWAKFVKANPNRNQGSNRSDSNKSFKPDLEKALDLPTPAPTTFGNGLTSQPIKPIPISVTPSEEPKPKKFSLNVGERINRGAEARSGGGGSGGGAAKKYGCPGGCP